MAVPCHNAVCADEPGVGDAPGLAWPEQACDVTRHTLSETHAIDINGQHHSALAHRNGIMTRYWALTLPHFSKAITQGVEPTGCAAIGHFNHNNPCPHVSKPKTIQHATHSTYRVRTCVHGSPQVNRNAVIHLIAHGLNESVNGRDVHFAGHAHHRDALVPELAGYLT